MSVTGDFAKLRRLTIALGAIANGSARRGILRTAAPVVSDLIDGGFRRQAAPRSRPWKALARGRSTGGGILDDTGALRKQATRVMVSDPWLLIYVSRDGAASHLYGARRANIPRRQFLPLGSMPADWSRRLNTVASSVLHALLA